jgi:Kef-type K+ transport system membrane component KefB/Trk K+ transport system NAD-binding subunit
LHSDLFSEIGTIIALATAVALVMRFLRQPLIIGHIITGILAGPTLLRLIHEQTAFSGLSDMGVALLLFIIGLDLSTKVFSRVGKAVVVTTITQVGAVTGIGFLGSRLLGFGELESAILGLGLAMSSTIIIVKLLNDKKETNRLYAQIAIGVLLLQDVVATLAKIALAAKSGNKDPQMATINVLLLRGAGLMIALYTLSRYIVPRLSHTLEHTKELMLLFALGWGLGFSLLFQKAGFSIEIGALFAGVSLASLPYSREMASRLKSLRDFFIVIFFITLGQGIAPDKLVHVIFPAVALSLIVLLIKPFVVLVTLGALGYTKRASFKTAVSMSQVSEFSLVFLVAALSAGLVSERAATTITLTALITFAASTYLIKYDGQLYKALEERLKLFERHVTKLEQSSARHHYPIVLFGYHKGGHEFMRTFTSMGKRFVVVDYDPDAAESLEQQQVNFLYGDANDPELLEEVGLERAKLIVSTMSDNETNKFIAHWLQTHNPAAVFVCSADGAEHAAELYEDGAAYVMLPHYIGSEKISNFIRKNGFNKTEFKRFREKHLVYLQSHHEEFAVQDEAEG